MNPCNHDLAERETAVADGYCPLCMAEMLRDRDAHLARLVGALEAARAHLEYCGYGDPYERECAKQEKLPQLIDEALADTRAGKERVA